MIRNAREKKCERGDKNDGGGTREEWEGEAGVKERERRGYTENSEEILYQRNKGERTWLERKTNIKTEILKHFIPKL